MTTPPWTDEVAAEAKRYASRHFYDGFQDCVAMDESPDGRWVKEEDYARLRAAALANITALEARVAGLVRALGFYANDENYHTGKACTLLEIAALKKFATAMDGDGGKTARAALASPAPHGAGKETPQ